MEVSEIFSEISKDGCSTLSILKLYSFHIKPKVANSLFFKCNFVSLWKITYTYSKLHSKSLSFVRSTVVIYWSNVEISMPPTPNQRAFPSSCHLTSAFAIGVGHLTPLGRSRGDFASKLAVFVTFFAWKRKALQKSWLSPVPCLKINKKFCLGKFYHLPHF